MSDIRYCYYSRTRAPLEFVDEEADDLKNYLRTKERFEELDAKIEQTDQLIDEIAYELYGLPRRRLRAPK